MREKGEAERRWERISELFGRAMETPRGSRIAWLDRVEPDESIRTEVRELLQAHDKAGGFLGSGDRLPVPAHIGLTHWQCDGAGRVRVPASPKSHQLTRSSCVAP